MHTNANTPTYQSLAKQRIKAEKHVPVWVLNQIELINQNLDKTGLLRLQIVDPEYLFVQKAEIKSYNAKYIYQLGEKVKNWDVPLIGPFPEFNNDCFKVYRNSPAVVAAQVVSAKAMLALYAFDYNSPAEELMPYLNKQPWKVLHAIVPPLANLINQTLGYDKTLTSSSGLKSLGEKRVTFVFPSYDRNINDFMRLCRRLNSFRYLNEEFNIVKPESYDVWEHLKRRIKSDFSGIRSDNQVFSKILELAYKSLKDEQ